MNGHISFEMTDGNNATIINPDYDELQLVKAWINSDRQFFLIKQKSRTQAINKAYVLRVVFYEE